jgi:hypothetical protein
MWIRDPRTSPPYPRFADAVRSPCEGNFVCRVRAFRAPDLSIGLVQRVNKLAARSAISRWLISRASRRTHLQPSHSRRRYLVCADARPRCAKPGARVLPGHDVVAPDLRDVVPKLCIAVLLKVANTAERWVVDRPLGYLEADSGARPPVLGMSRPATTASSRARSVISLSSRAFIRLTSSSTVYLGTLNPGAQGARLDEVDAQMLPLLITTRSR